MRNSAKDKAVSIEVSQKIAIPRVVNFIFSGFLLAGVVIDILVDVLFRRGNQTEAYEITNALYYPVTDAMNWIALAAMIIIIIAIILKRVDTRLALGITLVLTMMLFVVDLTMSTSRVTVFDDKVLITTFMSLSLTMSAGFLVGTALALPMGAVATAAIVGFGLYAGGEHLVTQQIPILLFVFSLMSVILVLYSASRWPGISGRPTKAAGKLRKTKNAWKNCISNYRRRLGHLGARYRLPSQGGRDFLLEHLSNRIKTVLAAIGVAQISPGGRTLDSC
jgi:hypothetical protein